MADDPLSTEFIVKNREECRDDGLRDYKFRVPDADTGPGTQPFIDASVIADELAPVYRDAQLVADATNLFTMRGSALDKYGEAKGRPRQAATKSTGYIQVTTATGGAEILQSTELRYQALNIRVKTAFTDVYTSDTPVAVESLTTGPAGNLDPGTVLKFVNTPVGVFETATVYANTDGSGLTGGAEAETDDEYRTALLAMNAEPPASGNEADYVFELERIPGLPIQKGFAIPAVLGTGTIGIMFTIRPAVPGASRLPNGVQIAQVEAALKDIFLGDDGLVVASGADHLFRVRVRVTWKSVATGWADASPWPLYYATPVTVSNAVTIASSGFRATSSDTIVAPAVGQTIGLYDSVSRTFKRKRILTVTQISLNHTYDLTFDMSTPGASDAFTPANGAVVVPWSESLTSVVAPILSYVDKQGPGEMFSSFPDPGRRQRRFPEPAPERYPNKIENRMVDGLFAVVADATIVEPTIPYPTTVGTPGVLFYLHRVSDIGVYPL